MNLENHQFFIALHNDTHYPQSGQPRIHAHILVNLIDNTGHHCPTDWDYKRIQSALRKLEEEFSLDSPFLHPLPSPQTQTDSRGQQHRYERELKEFHNPEHPRSQIPEKIHKQEIRRIIDDALATAHSWPDFTQQLNQHQITSKRSNRGWSVNFKDFHFAGYQLGKTYTLPSLLERLSVEQPNQGNPPATVEQPVVQSPTNGIGSVLAETNTDTTTPTMDAEFISQTMKVQPKKVVQHIADQIDHVDEHGRRQGIAQAIEEQSTSNMVDGTFLIGQLGQVAANTIRLGAEFIPERNGSDLSTPTETQQDIRGDEQPSADIIDGEIIVEPDPPPLAPVTNRPALEPERVDDARQYDEQMLAHNLSAFIEVRANAHQQPIDAPLPTRNGTVHLSGDRLTLTSNEPMQTTIEEHKQIGPDNTLETENRWISGERPPQFEATRKADGQWDVSINSLNEDTIERIAQLPTTPEEYQDYQHASVVVDHIRHQAQSANVPLNQLTEFEWTATDHSFKHEFKLEPEPSNGSIHITGKDSENNDIFDVTLRADHTLAVHQSSIDGNQIDQLRQLSELEHAAERTAQQPSHSQQLERTTSKGPQR